jgi:Adenosine deaminase z-alpha domain
LSCPALQLNTPSKPKRERFNHAQTAGRQRQADKARRLADLLREQRKAFPGFAFRIDQFIAQVEADASRTRQSDREKVLECLRNWSEGLGVTEIMEDTGLSHWDVRQILNELLSSGKLKCISLPGKGPPRLYQLKIS